MKKLILFLAAAVTVAGCTNHNYQDLYPSTPTSIDKCDTVANASTYSGNVKTLMEQYCSTSGCHNAGTAAGGYDLSNYTGVRLSANNGTLVKSIVWSTSGSHQMPQGGTELTECNLKQIIYWVNHGAQNN
jgi:hypothetical protein